MYDNNYMESKTLCEICGSIGSDFHHGIFKRMKKIPALNSKENMILVCKPCHAMLESMGYEGRVFVWNVKCIEFGLDHMLEWHKNLPMLYKENFV